MRPVIKFILTLFVVATLSACGYHLRGSGDSLPPDVKTMAIKNFANKTYESDLETIISVAISEEFSRSRRLSIVPEAEADIILEGSITALRNIPVSFSSTDVASNYRLEMTYDIVLKRPNGDFLLRDKGLKEVAEYRSEAGNVSSTQINMEEAKSELARKTAELVYEKVFEGF